MKPLYLTLIALIVCVNGYGTVNRYRHNHVQTHGWHSTNRNPLLVEQAILQWKVMEFDFTTPEARQQAEASGNFKPKNAMLIDVQPDYNSKPNIRVFVTVPRFQDGVPYSLATVSNKPGTNGPLLEPYPNYEMNDNKNGTNCDAITSAFRVAITECKQMWVMDSGSVGSNAQCPPQLLLFDLNTDQLVHRYRFKDSLYTPSASLFITPVVVVRDPAPLGTCSSAMVYVADVNKPGLVVYDYLQNDAWRVENLYMHPDPNHAVQSVMGESFVLMDGIFGMAADTNNLYFHPYASLMEYSVALNVLDMGDLFKNNSGNAVELFTPLGARTSACTVTAMDSHKNEYCVTMDPIKLLMWNVNTPYDRDNVIELPIDPELFQFVSGIKVVRNRSGHEELWAVSNRYQKAAAGTKNFDEVNFRIVVIPLPPRRRTFYPH